MKALITAGGHGTRLRPITHTQNKHLIPIANKLMLQYALEFAQDAGIIDVGIIINRNDESIKNAFGDGRDFGIQLTYIPQEAPLGLAHVVKISESFIGDDNFIFYLGDNILVGGLRKFIDDFEKNSSNCHLVLSKVPDPNRFGVAEVVDGSIVSIEEKPDNPKSDLAVTGIYLYDKNIFEAVNNIEPSPRGELEISDAHQYLLHKGFNLSYSEITGWWKDTGKPSDLLDANRLVLENIKSDIAGNVDKNSTISGRVKIGANSRLINSNIRGPVAIGNNTTIEESNIGPYSAIGNKCNIKGSEVEYSIIMDGCHINKVQRRIKSSLLGNNVEILRSKTRPAIHRFMLGDQSHIEIE